MIILLCEFCDVKVVVYNNSDLRNVTGAKLQKYTRMRRVIFCRTERAISREEMDELECDIILLEILISLPHHNAFGNRKKNRRK